MVDSLTGDNQPIGSDSWNWLTEHSADYVSYSGQQRFEVAGLSADMSL